MSHTRKRSGGKNSKRAVGRPAHRPARSNAARAMPQIQYSEKYYDDVYEYRCGAARDGDDDDGRRGKRSKRDATKRTLRD